MLPIPTSRYFASDHKALNTLLPQATSDQPPSSRQTGSAQSSTTMNHVTAQNSLISFVQITSGSNGLSPSTWNFVSPSATSIPHPTHRTKGMTILWALPAAIVFGASAAGIAVIITRKRGRAQLIAMDLHRLTSHSNSSEH